MGVSRYALGKLGDLYNKHPRLKKNYKIFNSLLLYKNPHILKRSYFAAKDKLMHHNYNYYLNIIRSFKLKNIKMSFLMKTKTDHLVFNFLKSKLLIIMY